MKKLIAFLLVFQATYVLAQTCQGIDSSFGIGGSAIGLTEHNPNSYNSRNILVQPDQKIIQVATKNILAAFGLGFGYIGTRFSIIRYQGNGQLDATFGNNGSVETRIDTFSNASAAALQPDGKIVVAGSANNGIRSNFALVRYAANGSLDNSFGDHGKVITPVGYYNDYGTGMALQTDGKIIVIGGSSDNNRGSLSIAIVRYLSNGSIDYSFGLDGKVVSHFGHFVSSVNGISFGRYGYEIAYTVAVQQDGKIVVAGMSYTDSCNTGYNILYGNYFYCSTAAILVRYNRNGTLDTGFGNQGKVLDSTFLYQPTSMLLQQDGKIVLTGYGYQNGFHAVRYNADGSPDNSFGERGKIYQQFGSWSNCNSVILQPDGKLLLAGTIYGNGTESNLGVARYTANGIIDNTLNSSGVFIVHLGVPGTTNSESGAALQGNNIVIAGDSYLQHDIFSVGVVRITGNPGELKPGITPGGPISFCQGSPVNLSCTVAGDKQWYRNGQPIAGATNNSYTATTGGNYTVQVHNANACSINGVSAPVSVIEKAKPLKPLIKWNKLLLSAPFGFTHYQWFRNDTAIARADQPIYRPRTTGRYTVQVTNSAGCSTISDPFLLVSLEWLNVVISGIRLHFFPNPATSVLNIVVSSQPVQKLEATLYDPTGRKVVNLLLDHKLNQLPLDHLPAGVYQLTIQNGSETISQKIMVIK
jgi:uncharacterized delta-60 repeat protein